VKFFNCKTDLYEENPPGNDGLDHRHLFLFTAKNADRLLEEGAEAEFKLEENFDRLLTAGNLDQWMKRLSARPHHLGSVYGKSNAEYLRDLAQQLGV